MEHQDKSDTLIDALATYKPPADVVEASEKLVTFDIDDYGEIRTCPVTLGTAQDETEAAYLQVMLGRLEPLMRVKIGFHKVSGLLHTVKGQVTLAMVLKRMDEQFAQFEYEGRLFSINFDKYDPWLKSQLAHHGVGESLHLELANYDEEEFLGKVIQIW